MSVINTNITSLIGQQNLQRSQGALQTSMERLSSGMRINSAKDDAAGQAIANRMSSQINGLAQAQRNANDGISVAQTAEGALNQVNDNLQRIRELSVQASNGTNSEADLQSIQDEINQRLNEINRISEETNFNGVDVLATDRDLQIQVGANDGESIEVSLREINAGTLNLSALNVTDIVKSDELSDEINTVTEAVEPTWNDFSFTTSGGASFALVVGEDNQLYAQQGSTFFSATFDADNNTVTVGNALSTAPDIAAGATEFDTSQGAVAFADAEAAELNTPDKSFGTVLMVNDGAAATTYVVQSAGSTWYNASLDVETGEFTVDLAGGSGTLSNVNSAADDTDDVVSVQEVLEEVGAAAVEADLATVNSALEGTNTLHTVGDLDDGGYYVIRNEDTDGNVTFFEATVDAGTGEVTVDTDAVVVVDPLNAIDDALAQVDALRSDLGAIQNRFEDAINNLATNETNLAAARSRIEDADYAVEVANMTRAQILQQAGTSVLAQANQVPQNVLSLLG